ncbi:MAG: hypothetical protein LBC88_06175, partial [Spirochaetaceae bacterium]|nr:hypothetical protein [Spirochaetaceae bacterium]
GFSIFSFDIGANPVYRLSDDSYQTATSFGLNLKVADPLVVGFTIFDSGSTTLLNLKYEVLNKARVVLSLGNASSGGVLLGSGSGTVGGLGFEYAPFSRSISGLATEFKMGAQYLFPASAIDQGSFLFILGFSVGI